MKILLVSANILKEPYPVYPLGLDYVAAAVSGHHDVQIADMNAIESYELLRETIEEFSPDVVGISLRNIDNTDISDPMGFAESYNELIKTIRDCSDAILVLGGSGFTIYPDAFMKALKADYGIVGEGERLALFLDAIENHQDAAAIPGVVTPGLNKPFPRPWQGTFFRDFRGDRPHVGFYLRRGGMLNLQTKRGCGYRCIYCTYPHIEGSVQRFVSPEEAASSAIQLQAAGAKYLFVTDSAFNSDVAHSLDVARAFIESGLSIPWGAYFTPAEPPPNYFRIMAEAGLTHVEFGTESLSDRVLASYRKPFRSRDVFEAHRSAVDAGLHVAHFFLLGGPGETSDTLDETLGRLDGLEKSALFFFCGMRVYPKTKLFEIAVDEGQTAKSESIMAPLFYRSAFIETDEILRRLKEHGRDRLNWIIGSGGQKMAKVIERLHERGHTGPLWEYLVR